MGAHSAPPDLLAGFKGLLLRGEEGREGKDMGKEGGGEEERIERRGERRGGRGKGKGLLSLEDCQLIDPPL